MELKNHLGILLGLTENLISQFKEEITQVVRMTRVKKFCTLQKDCAFHMVIRKMVQNS